MKKIFILLFIFAATISTVFITGCEDSGKVSKIREVIGKLAPMGEKAANNYLDKLIKDGKITKYQKDKVIKLYLKLKAKRLEKHSSKTTIEAPKE